MAYLIALDDGHGMDTAGKRTPYIAEIGRFIHENEFNREAVKYLDIELRRCGFKTLLVAPTDADTSLNARTKLANDKGADAYVSIHYDALDGKFDGEGKDPEGITVFHHPNSTEGKKLATAVSKYLRGGTPQKDRGVKTRDNLAVLTQTKMPSILTENGFMDNKREALLMVNVSFQKEVAREHAQGICEYFKVKYVPEVKEPVKSILDDIKKEDTDLYQPNSVSIVNDTKALLKTLESKGIVAPVWGEKLEKGTLTNSEAIGLLFVALHRTGTFKK